MAETGLTAKLAQTQADVAQARKRSNEKALIQALSEHASALHQADNLHEALQVNQEALALSEKLNDSPSLARTYLTHSIVLSALKDYETAQETVETALFNAERAKDPQMIGLVHAHLERLRTSSK